MQDLISFVQIHSSRKREDLAGEILALLLREESGQRVLRTLFPNSQDSNCEIDVFTRQRTEAGCMPDVHLRQDGRLVGLLELKFWASFTTHQLSGSYFRDVEKVFLVVPEERLGRVNDELSAIENPSNLSSQKQFEIISWNKLLDLLEREIDLKTYDGQLSIGVLRHIKEFCNVVEQTRFVPFTIDQLRNAETDITAQHLTWLTREAIHKAEQDKIIVAAGRLTAGYDDFFNYGQRINLCNLTGWLGYWPKAWKKFPQYGPLWIQFYGRDVTKLRSLSISGAQSIFGNDLAFPIFRPSHESSLSQEDELNKIVKAIQALSEQLDSKHLGS